MPTYKTKTVRFYFYRWLCRLQHLSNWDYFFFLKTFGLSNFLRISISSNIALEKFLFKDWFSFLRSCSRDGFSASEVLIFVIVQPRKVGCKFLPRWRTIPGRITVGTFIPVTSTDNFNRWKFSSWDAGTTSRKNVEFP